MITNQKTIENPASRRITVTLDIPGEVPLGPITLIYGFAPVSAPAKIGPVEPLPKITRAQREERRKNDPVMQELDKPVELDWSWLPEGLTPETLTHKDIREMRLKDKYGI
jgi:hypothetical protein